MTDLPARDAPLTFYGHPRSGNVYKVALFFSLSRTPHSFSAVDLPGGATRLPGFLQLNPFGQVPCLTHGDLVLRQSNVILQYLADLTGQFNARDGRERLQIAEWSGFEQDMLVNGLARVRFLTRIAKGDPAVIAFFKPFGTRGLGILDRHLERQPWLVGGRPTVADIACYAYSSFAPEAEQNLADYPAVAAWLKRIEAMPGWAAPAALMPV